MNLSPVEKRILKDCCDEFGVNPKAIRALLVAEAEGYFSNESQKSRVVYEMENIIKFWSIEAEKKGDIS